MPTTKTLLKPTKAKITEIIPGLCLNCSNPVHDKFCASCGQKAAVKRIDGKEVLHEIFHFFTHLQKNFVKTSYEMLVKPQVVQHNFLKGQRKSYHNPFSYLVIWIALEWIVKNWVIWRFGYQMTIDPAKSPSYGAAMIYFGNPTYLLVALVIPVVTTISYQIMSKPRFNYFETLVLVFYSYGTYHILLLFLSDILLGVVFGGNIISWQVTYVNLSLGGIWAAWNTYQFYKGIEMKYFWPKLALTVLFR
jgi:hypothetical protein